MTVNVEYERGGVSRSDVLLLAQPAVRPAGIDLNKSNRVAVNHV
jgi:hypothetical protein